MPLVFNKNYRKVTAFRDAHTEVVDDGDGFFADVTEEQLQKIVNQTNDILKKRRRLEFQQEKHDQAKADKYEKAADALLKSADSRFEGATVEVVWGVHQEVTEKARSGGGERTYWHFTVKTPDGKNQWHLYVDRDMQSITYLTPKRGRFVKVVND